MIEELWFAVIVIAFYALAAFIKYVMRVELRPRLMPNQFDKLVERKINKEIDETITEYDRFNAWLVKERSDVTLTNHQHKMCESWFNGIVIEELGGHKNAFGKQYLLNLIKQYRNY